MGDTKKVYVLDTSSIISNPECVTKLANGNIIVVPYQVILELDKHRKDHDYTKAYSARQSVNLLQKVKSKIYHDLPSALSGDFDTFENGGRLAVLVPDDADFSTYKRFLSPGDTGDNAILITTLSAQNQVRALGLETILVTEDSGLSLRAHAAKVATQEIKLGKLDPKEIYTGYAEVFVNPEVIDRFMNSAGKVEEMNVALSDVSSKSESQIGKFIYNQGVVLIDKQNNANKVVTTYNSRTKSFHSLKYAVYFDPKNDYDFQSKRIKPKSITKIEPRDERQMLYMEYLLDPQISLVAVNGSFGTGKTLLAVASAIEHLCPNFELQGKKERQNFDPDYAPLESKYDKLLILRPEVYSGPDLGYIPGDKNEKLAQFLIPFEQSIEYLSKKFKKEKYDLDALVQAKLVKPEATNILRGQSIHEKLIFMDEVQNGNKNLSVLFTSRMGHSSKVVALGDLQQIDARDVTAANSALSYIMQAIKEESAPDFAAITLTKNYRGGPSRIADTILKMGKEVHLK